MARKKKRKSSFLMFFVFLIIIIFAVLVINSIMDGELLKNLKIADEKKAEKKKQAEEVIEEKEEGNEEETEETFVKKEEDDTSFKLVDKTTDDAEPVVKPITDESKNKEREREKLAESIVKKHLYGNKEPEEPKESVKVLSKKSENIFIVEVRDNATTRLINKYEVNILKKEIVEMFY